MVHLHGLPRVVSQSPTESNTIESHDCAKNHQTVTHGLNDTHSDDMGPVRSWPATARRSSMPCILCGLGTMAVILLLVTVTSIVCVVVGNDCAVKWRRSEPSSVAPSVSPTVEVSKPVSLPVAPASLFLRADRVAAYINSISLTDRTIAYGTLSYNAKKLAEEQALAWLIDNESNQEFGPDDVATLHRLRQRYALATLWVQLVAYDPFEGIALDECQWEGVTCHTASSGAQVTKLYIDTCTNGRYSYTDPCKMGPLWTGTLSPELGLLTSMVHFNISNPNSIELGGLSGSVPKSLGTAWTNLQTFDVSYNYGLTGTLPSQIGCWANLQTLMVISNHFNGTLPQEIGQWTNLKVFGGSYNRLTGTLPSQIGQWTALQTFHAQGNLFIGTLPSQIGHWTNVQVLDVTWNELNGTIPSQLGHCAQLQELYMYWNNFTGAVPYDICALKNQSLETLYADCYIKVTCACCVCADT
jgi:hypothetical protein